MRPLVYLIKNVRGYRLFTVLSLVAGVAFADLSEQPVLMKQFIADMVAKHQFAETELEALFQAVEIKENILETMAKPAESMPWYKYRQIFMQQSRIDGGVQFWRENEAVLNAVKAKFHVPPEIITAIIGVETRYGAHTGSYRVIDALSTLAFGYPKRAKFFTSELEHFLLLCREQDMDPLLPQGSYAGAMGVPQFMPSSYRAYAADYEEDKRKDIWSNTADVIASVANYFAVHQWREDEAVAYRVSAEGEAYRQYLTSGLEPDATVKQLSDAQVSVPETIAQTETVKLMAFEQEKGEELWVGLHNFYVITRYNRSPLYALAVYQLSQAIADQKNHEL